MSNLVSLCDSLELKTSNESSFDKLLIDYLILITSEKSDVCKFARDPYLKRFIQLAFQPFLRLHSSSDERFRKYLLELIDFFKQLFLIHPAFLDCASTVLPIDVVLQSAMSTNNLDLLRGVVEFVALLATSPSIVLTSAASSQATSDIILSMINTPVLTGYAIVILSGLMRFSPVFIATIKSSTELRRYKTLLANAIASDDHLSVIASISSLLTLFPKSVDAETSRIASLHAINVSDNNGLLLKAATWVFVEVARQNTVKPNDFQTILKVATSSAGWKAFILFETLNCVLANSDGSSSLEKCIDIQQVIAFSLSQKLGYVSYSVVRFIQQLAEHNENIFDNLTDCESVTIKALEIVSAPAYNVDIDLVECSVVLLRHIANSKKCLEKIINVLKINEENVFVAFQRNIESNRSFTALEFFLFLADVSNTKPFLDWNKRLRLIVIDTQFGALLAHILEKSTDRQTLCDGIRAVSKISSFSQDSNINDGELLFDCIVSGFAVVNSQNKKDARIFKAATTDQIAKHEEDIFALRNQLELNDMELNSAKKQSDEALKRMNAAETKASDLLTKTQDQEKEIESLKEQIRKQKEALDELTQQYNEVKNQNHDQNMEIDKNKEKITYLSEQLQKYTDIEKEKTRLDRDNAQYEQKFNGLQQTIDQLNLKVNEMTEVNSKYKNKINESKAKVQAQNEAIQEINSDREKLRLQIQALQEKINNFELIKERELEKYNLQKSKNRELVKLVDSLKNQLNDLRQIYEETEQKNKEYTQQITTLLTEKKQWELITQFVHRITDDNPIPSEQLMSLFDEA